MRKVAMFVTGVLAMFVVLFAVTLVSNFASASTTDDIVAGETSEDVAEIETTVETEMVEEEIADAAPVVEAPAISPVSYTASVQAEKEVAVTMTAKEAAEYGIDTDCDIDATVTLMYVAEQTATAEYVHGWEDLTAEEQEQYLEDGYYASQAAATAAAMRIATQLAEADAADWVSADVSTAEVISCAKVIAIKAIDHVDTGSADN